MIHYNHQPSFQYRLMAMVMGMVALSLFLCSIIFYYESRHSIDNNLAQQIKSIVLTAVHQIDPDMHEEIFLAPEDGLVGTEEFTELSTLLTRIETSNQLRHHASQDSPLYTLRPTPDFDQSNTLEFVGMSLSKEQQHFVGNQIKAEPHHHLALTGKTVATGVYQDEAGHWISAVAPILDAEGNVIAILQADHHISAYHQANQLLLFKILIASGISLLLAVLGIHWFCKRLIRPILTIVAATQKIGDGDLSHRVNIKSSDELKRLANSVNKMAINLEQAQQELQEYNLQLEEKVKQRTQKLLKAKKTVEDQQEQLIASEKMASLGTLTAGIAHEVNNPIGYITSNLSTLTGYLNDIKSLLVSYERLGNSIEQEPSALENSLQQIQLQKQQMDYTYLIDDSDTLLTETQQGLKQIKTIVSGLKTYSHQSQEQNESIDVNDLIRATLTVADNELKYRCTIETDLQTDLPKIEANSGELNQVFLNLLINAGHAIEHHGKIQVKTKQVDKEVLIYICDSGCGIPEENLKQIYDPFFTTKAVGVGTGLGLSIVINLIKKHKGKVTVRSTEGKGTCFVLRFPLAK